MKFSTYEATSVDSLKKLIEKNKSSITLIDFYQPTCGPCIMLEPILEELVEKELVNVIKVDVANYPEIGREYKISVTPTIMIFKDLINKETIKGYMPLEEWMELIKKY